MMKNLIKERFYIILISKKQLELLLSNIINEIKQALLNKSNNEIGQVHKLPLKL